MGDNAEDMVDGSCCSWCGNYFKKDESSLIATHGYPVICQECAEEYSDRQLGKMGFQRAIFKTLQ